MGADKRIFGSVTEAEVAEAVYKQTTIQLDKRNMMVPEVKELGTYNVSVKLHPEVTATFQLIVAKQT